MDSCWPWHEAQQVQTKELRPTAAATAYTLQTQVSHISWDLLYQTQLARCNDVFNFCVTHDELAAQRLGRVGLPHCQTHQPVAHDAAGEGLKGTDRIQDAAIFAQIANSASHIIYDIPSDNATRKGKVWTKPAGSSQASSGSLTDGSEQPGVAQQNVWVSAASQARHLPIWLVRAALPP